MIDRDNDGIPDAEQLTLEEIEAVDQHFGEALIEILKDKKHRAAQGRQADKDFDPDELEYVATPRPVVFRSKKTGKRVQLNYNLFADQQLVELREQHTITGGVMGGRADLFTSIALSRLGSFGAFVGAVLGAGGSVPALLANAAAGLLKKSVKGKTASALVSQLLGVLLALVVFASPAVAQAALVLDHDMLTSLARTREPEVRIGYTPERVEFRTRRSALVGWLDVLLTARFERCAGHVRLVAQRLHVQALGEQSGKRFEQAKAGLMKLVNVKTAATRVEIYRASELVYSQDLTPGDGERR